MYRDINGFYPYQKLPKETIPKNLIVNITTPKEYGQQFLKRKRK